MTRTEIESGMAHFEGLKAAINQRLNEGYTSCRNLTNFLQGWGQVQIHVEKFLCSGKEEAL